MTIIPLLYLARDYFSLYFVRKRGVPVRIVLFYSAIESFNYYADQLEMELNRRGHETFILDLRNPPEDDPHSYAKFIRFIQQNVDVIIGYDGFGMKEDLFIEVWNEKDTVAVNIEVDPPLRFHPTMQHHPRKYIQLCCDELHVAYVKKYFGQDVEHVEFMPHAGTYLPQKNIKPFSERKYDILFSGTYYRPEDQMKKIDNWFPKGEPMNQFYYAVADLMCQDSTLAAEQAALDTIHKMDMPVTDGQLKTIFRCCEPLDWMARMHYRGRVIQTLAQAGLEIWLLGRGWENHSSAAFPNVHRIDDRIPFADTLAYMADAKISLNVMPWFKAGTHERLFNSLLQHSLLLTDKSSWIEENFVAGEEIAVYDLEHLEILPDYARELLSDSHRAEVMIQKGYEKTVKNYTWANCVDQILESIERIYG